MFGEFPRNVWGLRRADFDRHTRKSWTNARTTATGGWVVFGGINAIFARDNHFFRTLLNQLISHESRLRSILRRDCGKCCCWAGGRCAGFYSGGD